MGRYDNISVYHNGQWKQPNRIYVFNDNNWRDMGLNDSANTQNLFVRKNGSWVRATLNKKTTTVTDYKYINGAFNLKPANGFCFTPLGAGSDNATWGIAGTVRKTSSGGKRIFYCGVSSGAGYVTVYWKENGQLEVEIHYNSYTKTVVTDNSVGINQWVSFAINQSKGSSTLKIVFNGVTKTVTNQVSFDLNNATNVVGASGLQFKDAFNCKGTRYSKGATNVYFNINDLTSSSGNSYENASIVTQTHTVVSWE